MSEISTPVGAAHGIDLLDTEPAGPRQRTSAIARIHHGTQRLTQRGMSTAEYAVGILAAVSLALVLLRVITDVEFFKVALKVVLKIMSWVGSQIK
ncbi:DUF4244 domain-containing protein [Tessaracoccus sp. SD287]|uniref:DUF4244 domain-containing protein n=1 Tax=Tessaracoccus sp. SD287 TaxID=2782008 RepID=UPI001F61883D|nr:DUF4244 domain-containing protein [Tessaracoccus sp. SD287]